MRVACRQRRSVGRIAPRERGRLLEGCGGRAPSGAARGGRRGAAGHTRRAYRPHVRWAPARRPAASHAAQPRSQQTPLARPQTWALCTLPSRADARLGLSHLPAALLKRVVGLPSTRNAPSNSRAAGHTGQPDIPGSRTAGHTGQPDIPGSRTAGHTGPPDIPGSRTAGHIGQPGIPDRRTYRAAGHTGQPGIPDRPNSRRFRIPTPAAQHRSQQTPLARPTTWRLFSAPPRAVARLAPAHLPAALLKLALGGASTRNAVPFAVFPEKRTRFIMYSSLLHQIKRVLRSSPF